MGLFFIFLSENAWIPASVVSLGLGITLLYQLHRHKKIKQNLLQDPLTGCGTLTRFRQDAEILFNQSGIKKYALWYCDLKNFKYINDIYGYHTGDDILKFWAKIISENLQEGDIFARLSADNFVLLRRYEDYDMLEQQFSILAQCLCDYSEIQGKKFPLELAVGVYLIQNKQELLSLDDMITRAKIAQKHIKEKSGSRLAIYSEQMRSKVLQEKEMESLMENALKNKEFVVYLQPQIGLQGDDFRAEALVRWSTTGKGLILPGEFIPLFEKNGFVTKLDLYVLEEVCRFQAERMKKKEPLFCICVNVSRVAVSQPDFTQKYCALKDQYQIPDYMIELEFTENTAVLNHRQFRQAVLYLKAHGFLCAIDDFGSGYSSLNILKDLPTNVLKLDGEFFTHCEDEGRDKAIVRSVLAMAKSLNMLTVAEGVESEDQVEFLTKHGCDYIQGFVFSRPVPAHTFDHTMEEISQKKKALS